MANYSCATVGAHRSRGEGTGCSSRHLAQVGERGPHRASREDPWWQAALRLAKLRNLAPHKAPSTRITITYARVSTNGQKDDLTRQVGLLESFCAAKGGPMK